MPIQVSYPGVYVQEIPGGQPLVVEASTSVGAFVDFFARGPMSQPVRITSMEDLQRVFGGLNKQSEASYALQQFFLNGGRESWVVRSGDGTAKTAQYLVPVKTPGLDARERWAGELIGQAQAAADLAQRAFEAARKALPKADDNRQKQGQDLKELQKQSRVAVRQTEATAKAVREAAAQAHAASSELELAIAKAKAAAGPVPDLTVNAAEQAAKAASKASEQNEETASAVQIIVTANKASKDFLTNALKAAQSARAVLAAAESVGGALSTSESAAKAADDSKRNAARAQEAGDGSAALQAAQLADRATGEVSTALDHVQAAAQKVYNTLHRADEVDALEPTKQAKERQDQAAQLLESLQETIRIAGEALWDAQTILGEDDAKVAATNAAKAADGVLALINGGDGVPGGGTAALLGAILNQLLTLAQEAIDESSKLVAPPSGGNPSPGSIENVIEPATKAVRQAGIHASQGIKAAIQGATFASTAASNVGSAEVSIGARQVMGRASKASETTTAAVQKAKLISSEIIGAHMTALESHTVTQSEAGKIAALPRGDGGVPSDLETGNDVALDAARGALMAADNALAAIESIEKAALETANLNVAAAEAAEIAAEAATVAIAASEEAGKEPTLVVFAASNAGAKFAESPGCWGNNLQITIVRDANRFSLRVAELQTRGGRTLEVNPEVYHNLSLDDGDPNNAYELVNSRSHLIGLRYIGLKVPGSYPDEIEGKLLSGGTNGDVPGAGDLIASMKTLDGIEPALFNILCLPITANYNPGEASFAVNQAQAYAGRKRAFYIIDIPPDVDTPRKMLGWMDEYGSADGIHAAVYYPRLEIPDPLNGFRPRNVGASGSMAGIYSRTDTNYGVWKAPAGVNAVLKGAKISAKMTDDDNGQLNPRGVNALRSFPIYGNISWGGRTLAGADLINSEWKYINVRRLANFIEESLFRSLKWAVFESNNEILWSKIRIQVATFLSSLFAQGAFQGSSPGDAYFVKVDGDTTTPVDIDKGIVNVQIGFAPVKPAEFIILSFQQIAGQSA